MRERLFRVYLYFYFLYCTILSKLLLEEMTACLRHDKKLTYLLMNIIIGNHQIHISYWVVVQTRLCVYLLSSSHLDIFCDKG